MPPTSAEDEIIQIIRQAIEETRTLVFIYDGSERVVDPYVFGLSSQGNPLMRGYQTDGVSVSGKGPGWRVFQVGKMLEVDFYGEWFEPAAPNYDPYVPWIWRVDTQIT